MLSMTNVLKGTKKIFVVVSVLVAIIIMILAAMNRVSMLEASLYAFTIFGVARLSTVIDRKAKAKSN